MEDILAYRNDLQARLLGALMHCPEYCVELKVEDFDTDLQPVFAALQRSFETQGTVDYSILTGRYPQYKSIFDQCLCAADYAITDERMTSWVDALHDQRKAEKMQSLALNLASQGTDLDTMVTLYEQMGAVLEGSSKRGGMVPFGELIDDYIRKLSQKPQYIKCGIASIDAVMSLSPGNFLLIGGRPSAGKTALSLQMAANMAKSGKRVVYFSLETSCTTLCSRLIANQLNIPLFAVKNNAARPDELDRLADVKKLPLFLVESAGKSVAWMKAQAVRAKADVIFVDYLQLIHEPAAKDRYSAVTNISMQLHTMAQTTGITVVALSQLNRNAAGSAPTNADLRESGQLEQDADAIILLSADGSDYYAELTKNKEGRAGVDLGLAFNKNVQRFVCKS